MPDSRAARAQTDPAARRRPLGASVRGAAAKAPLLPGMFGRALEIQGATATFRLVRRGPG
jgi:hypothetical protein